MMRLLTAAFFITCITCAVDAPCDAATASLQLKPTTVTLANSRVAGQVTMSSLSARDTIFDLMVLAWAQRGDSDAFAPANDLIAVPSVYDISPFGSILVRFGLRDPLTALSREAAYQVRFREVLPKDSRAIPRVLTVPVFVSPDQPQGEAKYEVQRMQGQAARLVIQNESNAHVFLGTIRLEDNGQQVYSGSLNTYVLAGNSRSFALKLSGALKGDRLTMVIEGDGGSRTVDVAIR